MRWAITAEGDSSSGSGGSSKLNTEDSDAFGPEPQSRQRNDTGNSHVLSGSRLSAMAICTALSSCLIAAHLSTLPRAGRLQNAPRQAYTIWSDCSLRARASPKSVAMKVPNKIPTDISASASKKESGLRPIGIPVIMYGTFLTSYFCKLSWLHLRCGHHAEPISHDQNDPRALLSLSYPSKIV